MFVFQRGIYNTTISRHRGGKKKKSTLKLYSVLQPLYCGERTVDFSDDILNAFMCAQYLMPEHNATLLCDVCISLYCCKRAILYKR